jgi:hypothetical protein
MQALASQTEQLAKTLNALLNVVKGKPKSDEGYTKNNRLTQAS